MNVRQSTGVRNDSSETPCLLVGDIGGTNARFALADPKSPGFSKEKVFKCRDFASADIAINAYLEKVNASQPSAICIAAAGPIVDRNIRVTNNSWNLKTLELQKTFGGANVRLLNDFEAISYSIPHLKPGDCIPVGAPPAINLHKSDFTIGIAGPGTGLGIAGLCKRSGQTYAISGEGGHVGFAPETQVQMELLAQLRGKFDRVCDERLVSGPGVVNIFQAVCKIRDHKVTPVDAAEIFSLAAEGGDIAAGEAVGVFFEILGQIAGNLALALGAFDGVYLAGGIVARKPEMLANSQFRAGFERKGHHRSLMEKIPTLLITHPQPGLLGASACALQTFGGES